MTRNRIALSVTTLGLAGLLSLSGCGAGGSSTTAAAPAPAAAADFADEASALQAVGFETGVQPAPSASASASASAAAKPGRARRLLRKNTLHGELTVQGKQGARTIVVQRGAITAVTSTGISVKSSDGFTATWTFGDKLKIVQAKKAVTASALKTGVEVGVAGAKDGSSDVARLIAIK